jgi:hypothetical protein
VLPTQGNDPAALDRLRPVASKVVPLNRPGCR